MPRYRVITSVGTAAHVDAGAMEVRPDGALILGTNPSTVAGAPRTITAAFAATGWQQVTREEDPSPVTLEGLREAMPVTESVEQVILTLVGLAGAHAPFGPGHDTFDEQSATAIAGWAREQLDTLYGVDE